MIKKSQILTSVSFNQSKSMQNVWTWSLGINNVNERTQHIKAEKKLIITFVNYKYLG